MAARKGAKAPIPAVGSDLSHKPWANRVKKEEMWDKGRKRNGHCRWKSARLLRLESTILPLILPKGNTSNLCLRKVSLVWVWRQIRGDMEHQVTFCHLETVPTPVELGLILVVERTEGSGLVEEKGQSRASFWAAVKIAPSHQPHHRQESEDYLADTQHCQWAGESGISGILSPASSIPLPSLSWPDSLPFFICKLLMEAEHFTTVLIVPLGTHISSFSLPY